MQKPGTLLRKLNSMRFVMGGVLLLALVVQSRAADESQWIVAWGASPSPQRPEAEMKANKLAFDGQTIREIVHLSAGGKKVRVRLSNAFSAVALQIKSVHIGLQSTDSDVQPDTDRALTFSGMPQAFIPANAVLLSDPIDIAVRPGANLAISMYLAKSAIAGGVHYASQQTTYIGPGDLTAKPHFATTDTVESWVFLSSVELLSSERSATVVAFGDSITDGSASTVNANRRWPDVFAERLRAANAKRTYGVLDAGIGGNRILHDGRSNVRFGVNALSRFDRDVLSMPGVGYLIILEGINDLGHPGTAAPIEETVTAEQIIAGLEQLAARAHEKHIRVLGATLTPFADTVFKGYFTAEREQARQRVNAWIRSTTMLDAVIDFDRAARDPKRPDHLLATYDSGDHLHPNDAGYRAMAEAIDLKLFR